MSVLVEFQDKRYWYLGKDLNDLDHALAFLEHCDSYGNIALGASLEVSFAHVDQSGEILRLGVKIGNVRDLRAINSTSTQQGQQDQLVSLTLPLRYWLRLQAVLAVIDDQSKQLDYTSEQFAVIAELRREFNRVFNAERANAELRREFNRVFNAQRANAELPNPSAETEKSAKTQEQE